MYLDAEIGLEEVDDGEIGVALPYDTELLVSKSQPWVRCEWVNS
jgi:hypothetical protein